VGPARMIAESLTPKPGIREHNRGQTGKRFLVLSITGFDPTADLGCAVQQAIRLQNGQHTPVVKSVILRSYPVLAATGCSSIN
jgi:hypothetical protein